MDLKQYFHGFTMPVQYWNFVSKEEGRKKMGSPRLRWMEGVGNDL
jgi:hypothetical protein